MIEKTEKNRVEIDEKLKPITLNELMAKQFPDEEWLIDGLMAKGSLTVLSAAPNQYKTWLAMEIAIKVAKGEILFGRFSTHQTGVMVVDEDGSGERLLQKRFAKLGASPDTPIMILSGQNFKLEETQILSLIRTAKRNNIGLIIFDSLVRIHTAKNENDAMEMAKVFNLFKIFKKAGITLLILHHNRKQSAFSNNPTQDMRGSSDILAAVDGHITIQTIEEGLKVTQSKLRNEQGIKPFVLKIVSSPDRFEFQFSGELQSERLSGEDVKEAVSELLTELGQPTAIMEIFKKLKAAGLDIGYSTYSRLMNEWAKDGSIKVQKGPKNSRLCSLPNISTEPPKAVS